MKKILTLALASLSLTLTAQTVKNVNDLKPEEKAAATSLKLTGTLTTGWNSDFRQMRDLCFKVKDIDLESAACEAIPDNAFHSRRNLENIILPATAKNIGSQAFYACRNLTEITLPEAVNEVGDAAFSSCDNLKEINIEGTPTIGEFAFARLPHLSIVRVSSPVPPVAKASSFYGVDPKKVTLAVPQGSEDAYAKAEGWKVFYAHAEHTNKVCSPTEVLMPAPLQLVLTHKNALNICKKWKIKAADGLGNEAAIAQEIINERVEAATFERTKGTATITLALDTCITDAEAYRLSVTEKGVNIEGKTAAGVFYGLMTLDQLLRGDGSSPCCEAIPSLTLSDTPRTHIRELMLDPCRTFIPFNELKAFVREMARYKYNIVHLHLTDDQAWRIEIKAYPRLTQVSSSRVGMDDMLTPIEGYYTQEQMREFVAYAAKYHIQVVPEVEMPGHEVAAIHAYPALTCGAKEVPIRTTCGVSDNLLCPGSEFTFTFLGKVFKELADIFPSPYIHLGGDEAGNPALDCWTTCRNCQALKKKLGITTTDRSENWRLQQYMFDRVIDTLRTKYGKTPMFWYETDFKKIQPGCVTFAWRHGLTRKALDAAVANNAKILLCPGEHCYFDYPMKQGDMPEVNWGMPTIPLKKTYELDPAWGMGEDFEQNNLFGVAGPLWSECINTPERIYYQAYPRALALSEVGWSDKSVRSWEGFLTRLSPTLRDMMRRGISFSQKY